MKKLFSLVICVMAVLFVGCEPNAPEVIGVFSVSKTKQVTFSPGNLQYHPANNEWRFAQSQLDYIGEANNNISSTYNGWIDLFGWSTSTTNFGVSTSTDYNDYSGSFVDWGTNTIGNDAPNTWRTLSKDEWMYIFYSRPNAQSLFALGSVNGVNGAIVLPDDWVTPIGVTFVASTTQGLSWRGRCYYNSSDNNFTHNTYTYEQWLKMEEAGAVFFPTCGYREGTGVYHISILGLYWSSTEFNKYTAFYMSFYSNELRPWNNIDRALGYSVRLVKDL